jgi:hypothetical protein
MKDEQKVWIRGVEGRGKEVIKTLENLGGKNVDGIEGDEPNTLYYITHFGNIYFIEDYDEMANIIMDYYKEIKLPEQWKDGDILATDEGEFCVLKGTAGSSTPYFESYLAYTGTEGHKWHLATEEEVAKFHEYLHDKHGKEWDAEKRQLVDWKWKPKEDEYYYFFDEMMQTHRNEWEDSPMDQHLFEVGNCFRIREEAEAMAKKIKKLLKGESD